MFFGFCSFTLDERIWQTICPALFFKVEASFDQGLIPEQLLVSLNLFKSKICFGKRFGIGCQKEAAKAMFWKIKGQVGKVWEFWARLHHLSPCWGLHCGSFIVIMTW